jgi:hypothetical protein
MQHDAHRIHSAPRPPTRRLNLRHFRRALRRDTGDDGK